MKTQKIIVAIAAVFITATAMTGLAVASPESIGVSPGNQPLDLNQNPSSGTYSTYSIAVSDIQPLSGGNTHTIKATTTLIVSGAGNLNDLMFRFNHAGEAPSTWLLSGNTYTWTDGGGTTDSLTLDVMNTGSAENTKYQFKVYDSHPIGAGSDTGEGTVYGTSSIPEFATIAIPVAAILGLVLFFNHRKHKKE